MYVAEARISDGLSTPWVGEGRSRSIFSSSEIRSISGPSFRLSL